MCFPFVSEIIRLCLRVQILGSLMMVVKAYKNFNQAILAIELTGVTWDFGELVWKDVMMASLFPVHRHRVQLTIYQVMNTTDTAWCTR